MPERIAVQRLIIGEGKTRRTIMPGSPVTLDSETTAVLDRRNPPVVRDAKAPRPEVEAIRTAAAAEVARVAEPAGDARVVAAEPTGENITRDEAPGGGKETDDAPL